MKIKTKILLSILALIFLKSATAQKKERKAESYYNSHDYSAAIPYYEKALKQYEDTTLLSHLAVAYRNTHEYHKCEATYARLIQLSKSDIYHLYYAEVLKVNSKYKEAKEQFQYYLSKNPNNSEANEAFKSFEFIETHDMLNWVNVSQDTLLSSSFAEFSPQKFTGSVLITSDRKRSMHSKTYGWTNRPYLSVFEYKNNKFSPITKKVNNKYHNGPVSFDSTNNILYFTRVSHKISEDTTFVNRCKLFYTLKNGNSWSKAKPLPFNSDSFDVEHPCINSTGTILYFASNMPGGYGGKDLYKSVKTNNTWSTPINLGPTINTKGDEVFPVLKNETTLYFSSNGLPGYGGLDLFVSNYRKGQWKFVTNLKIPFNSAEDDFGILYFEKDSGLLSSDRHGTLGHDDLYSFNLKLSEVKITMIQKRDSFPYADLQTEIIDERTADSFFDLSDSLGNSEFDELTPDKNYLVRINNPDKDLYGKISRENNQMGEIKILINDDDGLSDTIVVGNSGEFEYKKKAKFVSICGKAYLKDSNYKLTQVKVILKNDSSRIISSMYTNEKGDYCFHLIPADRHYIIEIEEKDLNLKDRKSLVIEGYVRGEGKDDKPKKNIRISVDSKRRAYIESLTTDAGRFYIESLPVDDKSLSLQDELDPSHTISVVGESYLFTDKLIPNKGAKVIFKNINGIIVKTTDVNADGKFLLSHLPNDPSLIVEIISSDGFIKNVNPKQAITKLTFKYEDERHTHVVKRKIIFSDYNSIRIESNTNAEGFVEFKTLKPDAISLKQETEVEPDFRSLLKGKVFYKAKKPIPAKGVMVILFDRSFHRLDSAIVDANGNYVFKNLKHDEIFLLSVNEEHSILSKEKRTNAKIVVKGKVLNNKTLLPKPGIKMALIENNKIAYETTTDNDGEFYFDYLPYDHVEIKPISETDVTLSIPEKPFVIYYEFGKWNLTDSANNVINQVIQILKSNANLRIYITSHTDSRGSFARNNIISFNRSKTVYSKLLEKGISNTKIKIANKGEYELINNCKDGKDCSEEEHRLNRRSEIRIYK